MSANIRRFESRDLPEVRGIFFESSTKKTFIDDADKEAFFQKYLGFYLKHYPELAMVAELGKILGYVVAAPHSNDPELNVLQPHMKIFHSYAVNYPAHLHINCHHESRGMGVGRNLVLQIMQELKALNIIGIHIMTGPDSANQSFYKKLGFDFQVGIDFQGSPILFMGRSLV